MERAARGRLHGHLHAHRLGRVGLLRRVERHHHRLDVRLALGLTAREHLALHLDVPVQPRRHVAAAVQPNGEVHRQQA
eukprot:4783750-Pleurochrysis_carterae.AAC.2